MLVCRLIGRFTFILLYTIYSFIYFSYNFFISSTDIWMVGMISSISIDDNIEVINKIRTPCRNDDTDYVQLDYGDMSESDETITNTLMEDFTIILPFLKETKSLVKDIRNMYIDNRCLSERANATTNVSFVCWSCVIIHEIWRVYTCM